MNRRKKALQVAERLQDAGQHDTARRLVEAFRLEKQYQKKLDIDPEAIADIDDQELADSVPDLERYIPTAATLPDIDDEKSVNIDTGFYRTQRRLAKNRRR